MNTKTKLALAAVLFSAIASPSFAGDQDLASLEVSSGRILGTTVVVSPGAYAAAGAHRWHPQWTSQMALDDRLAQGHN
ncbi:MAG TPA: hypothetical protein VLX44_17995 [Xanthobacteraceae bacterium]|nr:hypothetical protein [Xanthobacteraceae bacterium]